MINYYENKIGQLKIEQDRNGQKVQYTIEIRQGNCLAVLIHTRKPTEEEKAENPQCKSIDTLYSFFVDEQHMKNIMKAQKRLFGNEKIISIKLNMHYKESWKLLKYLTKSGYKVETYDKEDKENNHGWSRN